MTDDPLDGADVGETVTVESEADMWLGDLADYERTSGTDRFATHEVADVEVRTDEFGDKHLVVTVESDVTKRLAPRWDSSRDPRTPTEEREARRRKWLRRLGRGATFVGVFGIAATVATRITNETMANIDIDGGTAPAIPPTFPLAVMLFAALILLIGYGLSGGFPGGMGGARR